MGAHGGRGTLVASRGGRPCRVHARQGDREITRAVALGPGKELWRERVRRALHHEPCRTGPRAGPKSTPAIAGGRVFTFGIGGVLSALDLNRETVVADASRPPCCLNSARRCRRSRTARW